MDFWLLTKRDLDESIIGQTTYKPFQGPYSKRNRIFDDCTYECIVPIFMFLCIAKTTRSIATDAVSIDSSQ